MSKSINYTTTLFLLITMMYTGHLTAQFGMHVEENLTVLFGKDTSGLGNKLMWISNKGAFRAGDAGGRWDDFNIGLNSAALGSSTKASGDYAMACGRGTEASGDYSFSMGRFSEALGLSSTALGYETEASGSYSTSFGRGTRASGNYSTAIGHGTIAERYASLSVGSYNVGGDDRVFEVGIGTNLLQRKSGLTVFDDGNVEVGDPGIGSTLLTLNSERPWIFRQYNSGSTTALELTLKSSTNKNKDFIIDTDAGVGIGTHDPNYKLHVNGSAGKPGGGSWSNASDRRLKTDIVPFNDGLKLLSDLEPVRFRYNGMLDLPTDQTYVGVIAQELQKIVPSMVSEVQASDGKSYLHVDPSAFDFILINAVKEQQKIIERLQEKVDQLERIVDGTLE